MLVLSRRPHETIVFPNVGITVTVVRVQGEVVRLGIDAPPDVAILRKELLGDGQAVLPAVPRLSEHALCNRLNKIGLSLHIAQRQLEQGLRAEASQALNLALEALESLDRENAAQLPGGKTLRPREAIHTLVVEDDANERELLAGLLRMNGCHCATAEDGEAALNYLARHPRPDFVLLDMRLPRCDGPQTLRRLRQDGRNNGLKVFAVTGSSPEEVDLAAGPGGVDAWFRKPLNPRTLWDAMNRAMTSPAGSN